MANTTTYAVNGKFGSLKFFGSTQDLRLTKWGLHFKGDTIDVTNTRSPAFVLGKTLPSTTLVSEWLSGVMDIELVFEGVYTILDASPTTYNDLLSMSSGTPGMLPGTSDTDAYGRASFTLTPDLAHYSAATFTGNCVIETFELDGELRGDVAFKGTAKVSGTSGSPNAPAVANHL